MPPIQVLPFLVRRSHDVVRGMEVISTRVRVHGLLRLERDALVVEWQAVRETSLVGREIRTDKELVPICRVTLPLGAVAGARLGRRWTRIPPRPVLVLSAADLAAFGALGAAEHPLPLLTDHPAEITLELRRADRRLAREFVGELELAIADLRLRALEAGDSDDSPPRALPRPDAPA